MTTSLRDRPSALDDATRSQFLARVAGLEALAACGDQRSASSTSSTVAEARRIRHLRGTAEPKRVLSLGFQEHDGAAGTWTTE